MSLLGLTPADLEVLRPVFFVYAFILGACVGSFLNVVIYRTPRGLSVVSPGSFCPSCNVPIRPYDNIPIISWLWLRGRCRCGKVPIAPRYVLVELTTAVLFAAIFARFGYHHDTWAFWVFGAGLMAVAFIDIDTFTIPYSVSLPVTFVGLVHSFRSSIVDPPEALIGMVGGALIVVAVAFGWWLVTKRVGMGMGDAALLGLIGAWLGYGAVGPVLFLASVQGLAVALPLHYLGRTHRLDEIDRFDPALAGTDEAKAAEAAAEGEGPGFREAVIMFGPFLCIAALEYLFFHREIAAAIRAWTMP